jgi:hypothetical protein
MQAIWVRKLVWIPVRRTHPENQPITALDLLSTNFGASISLPK